MSLAPAIASIITNQGEDQEQETRVSYEKEVLRSKTVVLYPGGYISHWKEECGHRGYIQVPAMEASV